jgi:hypothetical protein
VISSQAPGPGYSVGYVPSSYGSATVGGHEENPKQRRTNQPNREPIHSGSILRQNSQAPAGVFDKLVLVSWLYDAEKDVVLVQDKETNDVQKITSEPNKDNFRILVLHPNADPKLFEVVLSIGSDQGPVKFRFETPAVRKAQRF